MGVNRLAVTREKIFSNAFCDFILLATLMILKDLVVIATKIMVQAQKLT